ncbi:hypothetical protein [Chelativorans sp. YIM 93263]|uniref:hypothetical protein n=1 Tax=Chelativorans sp. YIM 93263 TaxID=2906648 RepID=UPI00237935E1|nr:hypothetical protein [Chelativorans sp. YIM 93263]
MAARKSEETVTGRWPVSVYDKDGKRVEPGNAATVTISKAAEFDRRFGRLPEEEKQTQAAKAQGQS